LPADEVTNLVTILTPVNATLALLSFLTLIIYTVLTGELVAADF